MAHTHIIFDLFGTLAAGEPSILPVDAKTFFSYGYHTWMIEDRPEEQYFDAFCEEHGCDPDHLSERFDAHVESLHLLPGASGMLEGLSDAGAKLHLLSNTGNSVISFIEREPAFRLFSSITLSCHVRAAKPDLRAFKAVLRKTGAKPSDCIMVGDNQEQDIDPASALGMQAIKVRKYKEDLPVLTERLLGLL